MPSTELERFLSVALKVQDIPWEGIRVVGGAMLATNGVQLVAWETSTEFISGDGMLPAVTAEVIRAYAADTFIRRIFVYENSTQVELQTRKLSGEQIVPGEFVTLTLPPFPVRTSHVESVLKRVKLTDARLLVENPKLKTVRASKPKDHLALVDAPEKGGDLFRHKTEQDEYYYNARQLQELLLLFRARQDLAFWINELRWLIIRDAFGFTAAVTPLKKR